MDSAPDFNKNRNRIKGAACGIRVEDMEEPLMQEIRRLYKLVDELAKEKPMEKITRIGKQKLCPVKASAPFNVSFPLRQSMQRYSVRQ